MEVFADVLFVVSNDLLTTLPPEWKPYKRRVKNYENKDIATSPDWTEDSLKPFRAIVIVIGYGPGNRTIIYQDILSQIVERVNGFGKKVYVI